MTKERITYAQAIVRDIKKQFPKQTNNPLISAILQDIPQAQIWHLPENVTDLLLHTTPDATAMEKVRLPHLVTLMEYNLSPEFNTTGEGQFSCRNRAALLRQTDDYISVIFIFHTGESNTWVPIPSIHIPFTCIDNIDTWFTADKEGVLIIPEFLQFDEMYSRMPKKNYDTIVKEALIDIRCVLSFMQITACSNATSTYIPVSPKIRRIAKLRGKYSPLGYREFDLGNKIKVQNGPHNKTKDMDGIDYSMRTTHWRKGHIRMQPTKKGIIKIWIQPVIVGSGIPSPKPIMVKA